MDSRVHWEKVWRTTSPDRVSWYQPHAVRSLELIRRTGLSLDSAVIDVGGGASALVDDLLDAGYRDVTVLDIAGAALAQARKRLGAKADGVRWIEGDVLDVALPRAGYDLWHDRAIFHFLTDGGDRARYMAQLRRALRPHGFAVIGTFAEDGPTKCSGLNVVRYSPEALHAQFGPAFDLIASEREEHRTPDGGRQLFTWCLFRRTQGWTG